MDSILDQVHGKMFSFCDMSTKKIVRMVNHSCGLDIDVYTGLSVVLDDQLLESLKFAQSVRITALYVQQLTSDLACPPQGEVSMKDITWLYSSEEFDPVHSVSLIGPVHWMWIESSLQKFSNLRTLCVSGEALSNPIFPYTKKEPLVFSNLRSLEICTTGATHNILHPTQRRYIFSDSTDTDQDSDYDLIDDNYRDSKKYRNRTLDRNKNRNGSLPDLDTLEQGLLGLQSNGNGNYGNYADESNFSLTTPVADNVHQLLSIIHAPRLIHLRLTYNDNLYNIGELNWRDKPIRKFLQRHASTLRELVLDGIQNDMENQSLAKSQLYPLPDNLRYLFVSIVDPDKQDVESSDNTYSRNNASWVLPFLKSLLTFRIDELTSLWRELLGKQHSLECLHCTIHAPWSWTVLSKCIKQSYSYLQVINIGCRWSPSDGPFNMEVISACLFLKKFTFTSLASTKADITRKRLYSNYRQRRRVILKADDNLESEKRCHIINFSSLISCVMLESIFITCALCETSDLDVLPSLPSLTCLVLMYVGKVKDSGVTLGLLEELLHCRSLNLLIVVEFRRQKHSIHAYRLKKILQSEINTKDCPIISFLVPYSNFGKSVYVGDIRELKEIDELYDL